MMKDNLALYMSEKAFKSATDIKRGDAHEFGFWWFHDIPVILDRIIIDNHCFLLNLDKLKEETMIELDEFKGRDYEELADRWGINTDAVKLLSQFIMDSLRVDDDEVEHLLPEVKADMEEFLKALIASKEKHSFGSGIFIALLMVASEDDTTFAQYFCTLLPHMWT